MSDEITVTVAKKDHKFIIGSKAATLKALQQRHSVTIEVPRDNSSSVKVKGSKAACKNAKADILLVVKYSGKLADEGAKEAGVEVEKSSHSLLIGQRGATCRQIESATGALLSIPSSSDSSSTVTILGTSSQIAAAKTKINEIIANVNQERTDRLEEQTAETEKFYQKYHKAIDKHAKLRAKYFEEAKACYSNGDKAGAKKLSALGEKEGKLLEKAKQQAAVGIFKHKNAKNPNNVWDLHGLEVEQAKDIVTAQIKKHKKKEEITIITGKGIHSEGALKLKPGLEEMLKKTNLRFDSSEDGILKLFL